MNTDLDFDKTVRSLHQGQQVFHRYKLIRQLGHGGMGIVWLAQDTELEINIALKFLPQIVAHDAEAIRDLKRETRKALSLTHSGIVRIFDFLSDELNSAISMEYVEGKTLTELKLEQPNSYFEVSQIKGWIQQICKILQYAHEKAKIAHRDLKPSNIMLTQGGEIKITDFGISSSITDTTTRVSMHTSSSGTPVYMSPQQMMGDKADPTDDIYSLGATIYELLTGKPPFYTANILMQVQKKVPPPMRERRLDLEISKSESIPQNWEDLVSKCLSKQVEKRPQNAKDVFSMLETTAKRSTPITLNEDVTTNLPLSQISEFEIDPLTEFKETEKTKVDTEEPVKLSFFAPKVEKNWRMPLLKIDMVWIFPGSFIMGSPESEDSRLEDEQQHRATINKGFWLGKYPITQGQWKAIMGTNPSFFKNSGKKAPVENVSWNDALEFCRKLTIREESRRRIPAGYKYSLPTEEQWEYACRAGTYTAFHYGSHINSRSANLDGRIPYGGAKKSSFKIKTIPVGKYKPNDWGLYDMHGNVWEWCYDQYQESPARIFRGGSWNTNAKFCRSAFRGHTITEFKDDNLGFRLALRPASDSLDIYSHA